MTRHSATGLPGLTGLTGLSDRSAVLAVITHFGCEPWLARSIESLAQQTRPPENIVVIDDASAAPPIAIVRQFPSVTLLAASENAGPYRLFQQIVDDTDYAAYLPQDADDWSAPERLAYLLAAARRTGAELVGCQIDSVYEGVPPEREVRYPTDCRAAVLANPIIHPVFLSAALIGRDLILRLGGFATGLRYGGDSEFLRRAVLAAKVVNIRRRLYYRRVHPAAATRRPDTGYGSPLRLAIQRRNHARARENVDRFQQGLAPDLAPIERAPPIVLNHLAGPRLRSGPRHG